MPDKILNHFVLADGSTAKYDANSLAGVVEKSLMSIKSSVSNGLELSSVSASDTDSNYYKSIPTALDNDEYIFIVTIQTAGTYLFQIGTGASASAMKETISDALTVTAGETVELSYTPSEEYLKFFRLYSANVPVSETLWSLSVEQAVVATDIKSTLNSIDSINGFIGCERLNTVKGQWYNTSGTTVDVNSPNSNSGWNSAVVDCVEEDVFTITGTGGSSPRLWAFADANGNILEKQDSATSPSTVDNYILYAPSNSAYFIVNFTNTLPFDLIKGLTPDYKLSIEDYENRITTKQRVVVDANGGGDYTTIQNAIASITDSSFLNQYEILLKDGSYPEQNLTLPKYVYLHGVGQNRPTITSEGLSEYLSVLDMQNTCRLSDLKVISATKYPIHEDVNLNGCTVICENVEFEQLGTMNNTIVGIGAFSNAKFIFRGCKFINGEVFSHTNSNSLIGVTQYLLFDHCDFDDAGIVLSVSGNVESNTMARCICEVVGCRGDETTPLITCRVPSDNVFPWKVIGGGNTNFNVVYDGETLTDVINTTD